MTCQPRQLDGYRACRRSIGVRVVLGLFLTGLLCGVAGVAEAAEVHLKNGDRLTGRVIRQDADHLVLEHEAAGTVTIAQAQVARIIGLEAAKPPPMSAPQVDQWSGEVSLGYNLSRGNTEEEALSGQFKASRRTDRDEWILKAHGLYGASQRRMNTQRYGGMGRYAFSFGSQMAWYNFYEMQAEHDRFANVDWRLVPSTGVGYWFSDQDDWKLMAELGIGVEFTEFRDGTSDRRDPVITPRAYAFKKLVGDATISQDLILWPSLGEVGEFRLRAETAITNPLAGGLALRLSFINEFQSDPAASTKKNDARLLSSLVYGF